MEYKNIVQGEFINRPNRFIANVIIDGAEETCHVKNTGRCKEILLPKAKVYLEKSDNTARKTKYSLIAVEKNGNLINIDSQAPNKAVYEWLSGGGLFKDITLIKPEKVYGNSRLDFYVETPKKKIFIEVKGATFEENGVAKFPDAPTIRGIKHLNELCNCVKDGYDCYVIFVIQMKNIKYFTPNAVIHKEFAQALYYAKQQGVKVKAVDCIVTKDSMIIDSSVKVKI